MGRLMSQTTRRRKIEVLVDGPLLRLVVTTAEQAGVTGYTLLPTSGGAGASGPWSDDQVSGAQSKTLFMTILTQEKADALIDALTPVLESHGLLLALSDVDVVRGGKF